MGSSLRRTRGAVCSSADPTGILRMESLPMIMNKIQCLQAIIDKTAEVPVVFTTGYTCRDAYTIEDRDNHFYMVGSMGMASAIGIGLALDQEQPVVVVDGDGALLMNPSNLFLSVSLKLKNLIHIVLDNGSYESTG